MTSLAATDALMPGYALPETFSWRPRQVSISTEEKVEEAPQVVGNPPSPSINIAETVSESVTETIDDSGDTAKIESAVMGALSELKRYEAYGRRWDGYFAEPFEQVVLERATEILRIARDVLVKEQFVPSLITTGPASDGSVDIEIRDSKKKLYYTIYPETVIEVTAIKEGAAPVRRMLSLENMALARWLDWLVGKGNIPEEMEDHRPHPR
jgi:hypothetical protein